MCLGARECNWERISRVALGDPDLRRRLQRMLCGGGASRPGALGGISPAWKLLGSKASGNLPGPRGIEPSRDPDFTDDGAIAFFAELGGNAMASGRDGRRVATGCGRLAAYYQEHGLWQEQRRPRIADLGACAGEAVAAGAGDERCQKPVRVA